MTHACRKAFILLAATWLVTACTLSEDYPPVPSSKPAKKAASPSSKDGTPAPHGSAKESPATPSSRDSRKSVASVPRPASSVPSEPVIERISGYKTPAEYLVVPSRHHATGAVTVTLPEDYNRQPHKKYPLVIAFGGAGECQREPREGSLAWMHYYKTDEAVAALGSNRLTMQDFRGLVVPRELEGLNRRLEAKPYAGVILACPASPLLSRAIGPETPEYEAFIMEDLIPALKKQYRVAAGGIGVDGVSMCGTRSMYYGFKYPEIFSSIGSVQGAFGQYLDVYKDLIENNRDMLKDRAIQLVTSDKDVMAPSVAKMHQLLTSKGIRHRYLVLSGPHDYIFNQGPGSIALLMFHNEALKTVPGGPVR